MTILTREAILQAQDLKTQTVPVPEWGGDVIVRTLTGAERDAFGGALLGADGKPSMDAYRIKLLAACIVGEDGQRLFTAEDVQQLSTKSAVAIERVFDVADALNSLGATAVEAAVKN